MQKPTVIELSMDTEKNKHLLGKTAMVLPNGVYSKRLEGKYGVISDFRGMLTLRIGADEIYLIEGSFSLSFNFLDRSNDADLNKENSS